MRRTIKTGAQPWGYGRLSLVGRIATMDGEPLPQIEELPNDGMLPAQFAGYLHRTAVTAERRLAAAVLVRAWIDLGETEACLNQRMRIAHRRVLAFFLNPAIDPGWPYRFEALCDVLGLSPEPIRAAIRERFTFSAKRAG